MVELEPGPARAHLAITPHPHAFGQLVLLGCGKMEKAHDQETAVVPERHLQAAPAAHDHIRPHDRTFHHPGVPQSQTAHGDYTGTVLIAVRQMKQQVLQGSNAQPCQGAGERITDPLEGGDGQVFQ